MFSSTALIAALEQSADPYHQRLVELTRREELSGAVLRGLVQAFKGRRVTVVGEPIIDSYILCDRPEVASESPVMTLRPVEARHYDGGAAIAARHLASLGARPVLVAPLPPTRDGTAMRERLEREGVEVRGFPVRTPVAEKQRLLVGQQKVMKLDLVEPLVLDAAEQERFVGLACEAARENGDAGIVMDFGLGLFGPKMMGKLCKGLRGAVGVLSGDVSGKRSNLRSMRGLDLLCPSEQEMREAMRLHGEGLPLVTYRMLEAVQAKAALVTLGAEGLIAFAPIETGNVGENTDRSHRTYRTQTTYEPDVTWRTRLTSEHIPALCPIALDPLGCGDSLLAVATLALASGGSLMQAAFLGACAAAVQVQRLGNVPVTPADVRGMVARAHGARLVFTGAREESMERARAAG